MREKKKKLKNLKERERKEKRRKEGKRIEKEKEKERRIKKNQLDDQLGDSKLETTHILHIHYLDPILTNPNKPFLKEIFFILNKIEIIMN